MSARMLLRRLATLPKGQTAGVVPSTARYKKVQELQNTFCRDDGQLVWQKLGRDKMFYYMTISFMILGFIPSLTVFYKLVFGLPKDSENAE